jgi:hypothetical protein
MTYFTLYMNNTKLCLQLVFLIIFTVKKILNKRLKIKVLFFHWLRLKGVNPESESSRLVQDFPPFPGFFPYFVVTNQYFN